MSDPTPATPAPEPLLARRPLGRTRFRAFPVGAGDVADRKLGTEACIQVLERAIERGANVLDTAPSYEDGLSETIVGHVVRNHRRESLFLIDKLERLRSPVLPQLDSSIFRLRVPRIDLAVFHNVARLTDLERILSRGGGMDECEVARKEGLIRYRGISSHDPEVVERALEDGRCEVLMFPLGPCASPRFRALLPRARERGVGTIGFKAFGAGKLLGPTSGYGEPLPPGAPAAARAERTRFDVPRCLRYVLTLEPDVVLLGMSSLEEVDRAFAALPGLAPMGEDELRQAEADAAAELAGKGRVWWEPGKPVL